MPIKLDHHYSVRAITKSKCEGLIEIPIYSTGIAVQISVSLLIDRPPVEAFSIVTSLARDLEDQCRVSLESELATRLKTPAGHSST